MFKKISNLSLIVLLAALIGIYFVLQWRGDRTKSSSFKNTEIKLDTGRVTAIAITGKAGNTQLVKSENNWKLNLANGKVVSANSGAVRSALEAVKEIKPTRIITKNEANWAEYEVDSTGTRVVISAEGKPQLDLIIGRFIVEGQNSFSTYMRLADAAEVFSVQNFLPFSISADPATYRNNVVSRLKIEEVQSVSFTYDDDKFELLASKEGWTIDAIPASEAQVNDFLQNLKLLTGREFFDEEQLGTPFASIEIQTLESDLSLTVYALDARKVVQSSINEESAFTDETLTEKLLKPRSYFLE